MEKAIKEEYWRYCEALLDDFKNQRIGCTDFIDETSAWWEMKLSHARTAGRKELAEELLAEMGGG
jgi:hypothetical protein